MSTIQIDRLRDTREVVAVLKGRQQYGGHLAGLHLRRRAEDGPARLAVVASRRVGGAVRRNRAKRLLREAARRISWPAGFDVVLVARAACADSNLDAVENELVELLNRPQSRGKRRS